MWTLTSRGTPPDITVHTLSPDAGALPAQISGAAPASEDAPLASDVAAPASGVAGAPGEGDVQALAARTAARRARGERCTARLLGGKEIGDERREQLGHRGAGRIGGEVERGAEVRG